MANRDLSAFERTLAQAWRPEDWCELSVLVAASGGPDSMALLRALHTLKNHAGGGGRLIVAHFNHRLRPEAADDEAFVRALAESLELEFQRGEADVRGLNDRRGDGIESAAREARYMFLKDAAQRAGARYVATGHTADDQIETVLFNLLRGTGLAGLAGIPRFRPLSEAVSVIRPLLGVHRCDIIEYLEAIAQPYRADPTNACREFMRNRIRHELLPLLRAQYNTDVDSALARLAQIAADAQEGIEREADKLLDRCLLPPDSARADAARIDARALAACDRHLVREMLVALWRRRGWPVQDMGFDQWNLLADMALHSSADASGTKRTFPGNVLVHRDGNELIALRGGEH